MAQHVKHQTSKLIKHYYNSAIDEYGSTAMLTRERELNTEIKMPGGVRDPLVSYIYIYIYYRVKSLKPKGLHRAPISHSQHHMFNTICPLCVMLHT